jgi:hypothetical protein
MKRIAFTLVLNGMPFIKQQAEIIPKIFDEWYIIEGAVIPVRDTGWCKNIPQEFYSSTYRSIDGTSEFLDSIECDKIKIIRKSGLWEGKLEMCNSFITDLENCTLMEFDVDEIWDIDTLHQVLEYAEVNDHFDSMIFKCNYYVGSDIIITSEGGYADHSYEWIRLWKIKEKTKWKSHEPPILEGCERYLSKTFTKERGWLFDHYAYTLEDQLTFKEKFYGYAGALDQWKRLQNNATFPCLLREYLPWVHDNTVVDKLTTVDK